jgi:N-acetyl-anhydromuramyl-L-alanine amidase AmpD
MSETETGGPAVALAALPFQIDERFMIPVQEDQAVARGWLQRHGSRPLGVTWHWGVVRTLRVLTQVLGGADAERKGKASAHYGIGRSFAEGVHRYVSLENRSFHAGINQSLRWNGRALLGDADFKATRTTIGIETVHIGAAVPGIAAQPDWIHTATPQGRPLRVQPWTQQQLQMCIEIGREIVRRWPHIDPEDHHGHHDICPLDPDGNAYKIDVCGFPFAKVLRGIYPERIIHDVWTPLETVRQRQRALIALGFSLGRTGADGDWGRLSGTALRLFQRHHGMVINGLWSTFVSRKVHAVLAENGRDLQQVTAGPL